VRCFKIISSIINVVVESSTRSTFLGISLPRHRPMGWGRAAGPVVDPTV
jgi:hypothetical protein